jgi:hypothetical protein
MGARSSRNTTQNNRSDGHLLEYFRNTFLRGGGGTNAPLPLPGITATGGVISDYTSGPAVYRAHVFTSTGTFSVSAATGTGLVEYLVVAGGGGAGADQGGGGGAGGLRTNLSGHPLAGSAFQVSSSPGSYTVTIGAGGKGSSTPGYNSTQGEMSEFYLTPASYPSTQRIRAVGGGLGGGIQPPVSGGPGGSGGGGGYVTGTGGSGNSPDPNHPQRQGYDGEPASAFGPGYGGGGGGAGGAGASDTGGVGVQVTIAGPPTTSGVGALNPGPGEYQWFAGGGAGRDGSPGGSGGGTTSQPTMNGVYATGGGGGAYGTTSNQIAGSGGSGIVVVRYQIASLTATAKATGGLISFYSGKTIHTFTSSGSFANTSGSSLAVEYLVVAGGAGGGSLRGGGGGSGGYATGPASMPTSPVTIQVGAGGAGALFDRAQGGDGTATDIALGSPLSVGYGGGGGGCNPPTKNGRAGGPGTLRGGNGGGASHNAGAGTGGAGGSPSGTAGGDGNEPTNSGGGGGGHGSVGQIAGPLGGVGGIGIQVPSTFQNPASAPQPGPLGGGGLGAPGHPNGSSQFFLSGGGGGGANQADNPAGYDGGAFNSPTSYATDANAPFAGGGRGGNSTGNSTSALQNTGGGGGGGGGVGPSPPSAADGASGGSGIVIIAYPS